MKSALSIVAGSRGFHESNDTRSLYNEIRFDEVVDSRVTSVDGGQKGRKSGGEAIGVRRLS